jgi:2-polyprenyl-3-methyl-5-hydroxy-6-metoxy-1,4-benzoquinol methylase
MPEWFNNSNFWQILYPFMFPEKMFDTVDEQVNQILSLVSDPGIRILDLCCGPGRISIPLAERGFDVTGVDITEFLFEKARKQSEAIGTPVEWVLSEMREFVRLN